METIKIQYYKYEEINSDHDDRLFDRLPNLNLSLSSSSESLALLSRSFPEDYCGADSRSLDSWKSDRCSSHNFKHNCRWIITRHSSLTYWEFRHHFIPVLCFLHWDNIWARMDAFSLHLECNSQLSCFQPWWV